MKKSRFCFIVLSVTILAICAGKIPSVFCETQGTQELHRFLQQAQELSLKGELLEAQKIYQTALNQEKLSEKQKRIIQKHLEKLNLQLIFSRFETPDTRMYTVVVGDSLYEIARKHKTTIDLIKKSNGLHRDTIYPGMKLKVMAGVFSIHIDKSDNVLTLLLDGKPIKHYRVATGKDSSTPEGQYEIVNKLVNPTWYHAGAIVPPESPENILGTRWLGFDHPGYGIHGTTMPETIGKQASHGCVRMLNRDVEELYTIIPTGTKIVITD